MAAMGSQPLPVRYVQRHSEPPSFSEKNLGVLICFSKLQMFGQARRDVILVECMAWYTKYRLKDFETLSNAKQIYSYLTSMHGPGEDSSSDEDDSDNEWEDNGPLEGAHVSAVAMGEVPLLSIISEMQHFEKRRKEMAQNSRSSMYGDGQRGKMSRNKGGMTKNRQFMGHKKRRNSSMALVSTSHGRRVSMSSAVQIEKQSEDVALLESASHGQYVLNRICQTNSLLSRVLSMPDPKKDAIWSPGLLQPLTYGDLSSFIKDQGDLRKIGAKREDFLIALLLLRVFFPQSRSFRFVHSVLLFLSTQNIQRKISLRHWNS